MDDKKERTIYCGNLSDKVTEELLYELFLQAGPVECVKIPNGRNYAFITFKHEVSVNYAVALMNGLSLFGKEIRLELRTGNASGYNPYLDRIEAHKRSLIEARNVYPNRLQMGNHLWSESSRRSSPYPCSREEKGYPLKDRYTNIPLANRSFTNNGLYPTPPHLLSMNSSPLCFDTLPQQILQNTAKALFTSLNHAYSPYPTRNKAVSSNHWRESRRHHH